MNIHLLSVFQWHFRGICCEGRTHYVTDSPTGCVKLISPLDGTVEFLTHLGHLFRNFGIHLRGQSGMDSNGCQWGIAAVSKQLIKCCLVSKQLKNLYLVSKHQKKTFSQLIVMF